MEVAVSDLRANLRDWLKRAQEGNEVVITDRGVPVARLIGVQTSPLLDRLTAQGVIGRPISRETPAAAGRRRPRPRRPIAPIVREQRR
jgi:prevent-host-death family protein